MSKVFEDYFSELQADMVSICLEYVDDRADNIYIYCSCEDTAYATGYFYKINGKMKRKHKVNEELPDCDVSYDVQEQVLDILTEDLLKIHEVCEKYEHPMPTEMKLVYDVKRNSLTADYRYDYVYSNDPEKVASDIELEWFEEIKAQEENK